MSTTTVITAPPRQIPFSWPSSPLQPITATERSELYRWLRIAFLIRFALMLLLHVTGLEQILQLTKDAYLYDAVAQQVAAHWSTNGRVVWPARVTSVIDALYEYEVAIIYYLTGNSMLVGKLMNVIAGTLVPLVVWRSARMLFDARTSRRALVWAALFPTQVYYSTMLVRDMQSTLAMSLVLMGLIALARGERLRYILALPVGLALTAGFRTYMFSVLMLLIPVGWVGAIVIAGTRARSRVVQRVVAVTILAAVCCAGIGAENLFAGREGQQITDLDFLNRVREKLNRGSGALYKSGDVPDIGRNVEGTATSVVVGMYFFFFSVNPLELGSFRQFLAIPEVLLVVYALPALWRGLRRVLRNYLFELFVPVLIATAVTFAYSSVATNGGPLMRWRLQVINVYLIVAAVGWEKRPIRRRVKFRQVMRDRDLSGGGV